MRLKRYQTDVIVPLLWLQGEGWSLLLCEFEPRPLWDYYWMKNLTKDKQQNMVIYVD